MGNGSLNSTKYTNLQALGVSSVTSSGTTEVILNQVATVGSYTFSDAVLGTTREWVFHGTQSRSAATASTYTLRHKTNGAENMALTLPATSATVYSSAFVLRFRIVRYQSGGVSWSGQWSDTERNYNFYSSQNAGGGIPALNVSAAFTITFQSNVATSTIFIHHVDVNNIYA